ncbi:MAG: type IX secretion system membrane protein PorP/SprF [Flavobacteriales bacterium]|nr:type IX secretion system membrane protein PorP/SprF [Flavobacteriales bacterium]
MRSLVLIGCLLFAKEALPQLLSQYTQYVFNHFSINPGVAGSKDCLDLRLGFRQQWVGFEGAPTTGWASLHGTLRSKGKPFQGNKHGVGMFVEADQAGNWGYTRFLLAYAYHIQMAQDYYMSLGMFGGVQQMKFSAGESFLLEPDDPAIAGRASVLVAPEITPGIWFYSRKVWAGLAIHQALGNRMKGIGVDARLYRHVMLSGGYKYRLGKHTSFTPSALLKFAGGAPAALDINAMVEWKRTIALGVGYRGGDAFSFLMKVGFMKFFQLGYSYDVTTSRLRVAGNNTHEIILGITPCSKEGQNKRMINCPAFD